MDPVLNRSEYTKEKEKDEFEHKLVDYIEAYASLSQVVTYDASPQLGSGIPIGNSADNIAVKK